MLLQDADNRRPRYIDQQGYAMAVYGLKEAYKAATAGIERVSLRLGGRR